MASLLIIFSEQWRLMLSYIQSLLLSFAFADEADLSRTDESDVSEHCPSQGHSHSGPRGIANAIDAFVVFSTFDSMTSCTWP